MELLDRSLFGHWWITPRSHRPLGLQLHVVYTDTFGNDLKQEEWCAVAWEGDPCLRSTACAVEQFCRQVAILKQQSERGDNLAHNMLHDCIEDFLASGILPHKGGTYGL